MNKIIASNTISLFDFWLAISIPFLIYKGLTIEQALALAGIYNLLCTLFEYPTGVIGDYFGHRASVILGNLSTILSYTMLLLAQSYSMIFLALIFRAVGISLKSGSTEALLKANSSNYRKEFGKLASLEDFALFSASVVSGFIAQISYEVVLLISIALSTFSTFLLYGITEPKNESENTSDNIFALANDGIRFSIKNKHIFMLILLFAFYFGYSRGVKAILSIATEQFGFGIQYLGIFIGAGMLSRSIGKYIFGKFENISITVVVGIFASLLVTSAIFANPWIFVISIILSNSLIGVIVSWVNVQLVESASSRIRASVLSFSNLLSRFASSLFLFALGAVLTGSSIHTAMLITTVSLSLCYAGVRYVLGKQTNATYPIDATAR